MRRFAALVTIGIALAPVGALAEYPDGNVTIVVPFSAGGATDAFARFLAEGLGDKWGVPVVVENKGGASSTIGTAFVANAEADGRTLLVTTPSIVTTAAIQPDLPYDPLKDIQPVSMIGMGAYVLAAGPKHSATTLAELQAMDGLFYGAVGVGSTTHFVSAMLMSTLGLDAEPVFYKGGTDAVVDVIGGRLDVYLGTISQIEGNIQAGQVRGIAVTGPERNGTLPDVPTLKELGVDATFGQWWALFTTGGTPAEVVATINADVSELLASEEAEAFYATLGAEPVTESVGFMEQTYRADIEQWKSVAAEHGIRPE